MLASKRRRRFCHGHSKIKELASHLFCVPQAPPVENRACCKSKGGEPRCALDALGGPASNKVFVLSYRMGSGMDAPAGSLGSFKICGLGIGPVIS